MGRKMSTMLCVQETWNCAVSYGPAQEVCAYVECVRSSARIERARLICLCIRGHGAACRLEWLSASLGENALPDLGGDKPSASFLLACD